MHHRAPNEQPGRGRYKVFGFVLFASALIAGILAVAGSATDYTSETVYATQQSLGPGGYYQTSGWNYRTENDGCRSNNSGQMSVAYYDTNNVRVTYSGVYYTNCNNLVTATITNNGYYRARCTNEGTIVFPVSCWAWNYTP